MKKITLFLTTTISSVVMLLSPVAVLAETGTGSEGTGSTGTEAPKTQNSGTTEDAAKKAEELKKRTEENKAKLKTRVDDATKKRITAKCKPAQTIVKGADANATKVSENRSVTYQKIGERIDALIVKLKAAGINTTNLEVIQATAKQKAEALSVSMKSYQQTLADLQAIDCVADPTAFAATLERARTERTALKAQASELRTYMSTTLKEAINKVKAELEAKKAESDDSSESTESNGGTR